MMEKLSKAIGWCFQHFPDVKNLMGGDDGDDEKSFDSASHSHQQQCIKKSSTSCRDDLETSKKIFSIIESIIMWKNSLNSISVVVVFNLLFWSIVVLEIRGFAAASSAALVAVLSYSILEAQGDAKEQQLDKSLYDSTTSTQPQTDCINKLIVRIELGFENLMLLRKNQPGVFCIGVCTASILIWLIGGAINGVLTTYIICMSILLGPALFMRIPRKIFTSKEWESEIDEFLPVVTEDNLQLLNRAGETGDHSPTPFSSGDGGGASSDNQIDLFNDDELIVGLKMPSHEDGGSTDGLELSELELSGSGGGGLKISSRHFERGSSSSSSLEEDEQGLELESKDLSSDSDEDSDGSEFEVIDSNEINR